MADDLKDVLLNMELRQDLPQAKVLYAVTQYLPRIMEAADLESLIHVMSAFAKRTEE